MVYGEVVLKGERVERRRRMHAALQSLVGHSSEGVEKRFRFLVHAKCTFITEYALAYLRRQSNPWTLLPLCSWAPCQQPSAPLLP